MRCESTSTYDELVMDRLCRVSRAQKKMYDKRREIDVRAMHDGESPRKTIFCIAQLFFDQRSTFTPVSRAPEDAHADYPGKWVWGAMRVCWGTPRVHSDRVQQSASVLCAEIHGIFRRGCTLHNVGCCTHKGTTKVLSKDGTEAVTMMNLFPIIYCFDSVHINRNLRYTSISAEWRAHTAR